jgi:hypothetical protein
MTAALKLRRLDPRPADRDLATEFLKWVVDNADLLDVVTDVNCGVYVSCQDGDQVRLVQPTRWLLVPVPSAMLDELALVGTDIADLEDGADAEPDADEEDDGITEPNLGWEHWVPDWRPWLLTTTD